MVWRRYTKLIHTVRLQQYDSTKYECLPKGNISIVGGVPGVAVNRPPPRIPLVLRAMQQTACVLASRKNQPIVPMDPSTVLQSLRLVLKRRLKYGDRMAKVQNTLRGEIYLYYCIQSQIIGYKHTVNRPES